MNTLDNFYAFKFLRLLTKPWEQTEAFKLGIIDKNGKEKKRIRNLRTPEEKKAYNRFTKLVFQLRRMLQKVPLASTTIGRYTTALMLIKEECGYAPVDELLEHLAKQDETLTESLQEDFGAQLKEMLSVGGFDGGGKSILPLNKRKDIEEDVGDDTFAGDAVFHCDPDTFQNCRLGKKKFTKYKSYVGEGDQGERIRVYGRKFPRKGIILKDNKTGAMRYLRRSS